MRYIVVFERSPNNWAAYVPDVPGCVAAADTREETEQLIREALHDHLELMIEENEPIPEPGAWTVWLRWSWTVRGKQG